MGCGMNFLGSRVSIIRFWMPEFPPVINVSIPHGPEVRRQSRAAADAKHGAGGTLPEAPDQRAASRAQCLPVPAARRGGGARRPSLIDRHHLRPGRGRPRLPVRGNRLEEPLRDQLEPLLLDGRDMGTIGPAGGAAWRPPRDLQHRPGQPFHCARLRQGAHRPGDRGEHGLARPRSGPRLRGAGVEERQVRGHLLNGLLHHVGAQGRAEDLLRVLQPPEAALLA